MAIKGIDTRLDALAKSIEQADQVEPDLAAIQPPQGGEPETEPVEVAGLGTVIEVIKAGVKPIRKIPESMATGAELQEQVVKGAAELEKAPKPGLLTPKKKIKEKPQAEQPVTPPVEQIDNPVNVTTTGDVQTTAAVVDTQNVVQAVVPPNQLIIETATPVQAVKFLSGMDAPAVGIDINYNYIQGPEDIDKILDATSKVYAKEIDVAKRGVLRDEAVRDMAARLNVTPEIINAGIGSTFNAETMLAARELLVRSASKLDDIAKKVKQLGPNKEDDALLLEFRNQLATHAAIQMKVKAAQTEIARALRSFRLPVDGTTGIGDPNAITTLLNENGGRLNLKQMAEAFDTLSMEERARFVQMAGGAWKNLGSIWKEMYTSSIMYSPATIERNLYGNIIMNLTRGFDTTFAATAGRALDKPIEIVFGSKSSDRVYASEAAIELANFFLVIPKAWKAGVRAFKTDTPQYSGRDADKVPMPALSARLFADPNTPSAKAVDFMGKAIRLPFRFMLAGDEFGKATVAQMETRRLAARQAFLAIDNGVPVDQAIDGMVVQITNPDAKILQRVDDSVKEATFQSDMGQIGNTMLMVRNRLGPVGTVLAPFVKTVVNVEKELFKRTPFAPVMKEVRDELAAGGARREMALGKMSMGSSFMGFVYYLALDGTITGAGPTDPKRKEFLRQTNPGWQPFSINFGDGVYRSYAGLEPFGGLMGMAASLAEVGSVYAKDDDTDWTDLLLYSALLPFKYIGELPFMSGMANFTSMIEELKRDPTGERASAAANKFFGGIAQNFPAGMVPIPTPAGAMIRQIETAIDPTQRQVRVDPSLPADERYFDFLYRTWAAKNISSGAPTRNVWGKEVQQDNGPFYWIVPFYTKESELDTIDKKIVELARITGKQPISLPERNVANIGLNDAEYSDLILTMNKITVEGRGYKQAVAEVLSSGETASDLAGRRYQGPVDRLSKIKEDFKEMAFQDPGFQAKYPDLVKNVMKNQFRAKNKFLKEKREPVED
jgi:hypothetical protein